MSQVNVEIDVEIVGALAGSFQRGDHELAFDFYDPEIEWDASRCAEAIPTWPSSTEATTAFARTGDSS
jgi:hypothetical protein